MKTMMVGYDLNSPGQKYDALISALQAYPRWWHYLDSTWLLKTDDTHVQVRDALLAHLDAGDELLVMDVTSDAAAWTGFAEKAAKWIKDYL